MLCTATPSYSNLKTCSAQPHYPITLYYIACPVLLALKHVLHSHITLLACIISLVPIPASKYALHSHIILLSCIMSCITALASIHVLHSHLSQSFPQNMLCTATSLYCPSSPHLGLKPCPAQPRIPILASNHVLHSHSTLLPCIMSPVPIPASKHALHSHPSQFSP